MRFPSQTRTTPRMKTLKAFISLVSGTTGSSSGARRRGVTMIESMITLVVLGTTMSMALPKMNASVRQRRVIAAANALNADVPVAFSLAARQRKPVTVSFHSSTGEIRIQDRSTNTVYHRRALLSTSEYQLDSVKISPATIQLFPNGVASSAFTVSLYNGRYSRVITVGRTGFTRVTVP